MTDFYVYLAGPVLGCTDKEANTWRYEVDKKLRRWGESMDVADRIYGISPLRCEQLSSGKERYEIGSTGKLWTPQAILAKNLFDVRRCDITLAYLPKPEKGRHQSYGTIMEVAWAHLLEKPVVIVTNDPTISGHALMPSASTWMFDNFDDAVLACASLLLGYTGQGNI